MMSIVNDDLPYVVDFKVISLVERSLLLLFCKDQPLPTGVPMNAMNKLFRSLRSAAMVAGLAVGAGGAQAAVFTEDFEDAFPAWETDWFGAESTARNYYCFGALNCANRGNNPDGLWISDVSGGSVSPVSVQFSAGFGGTLTSLSLDIASYITTVLTAYDSANNQIYSQLVTNTSGAYTDPGVYSHYTITSSTGIGRFELSGGAKGNVSIDNLVGVTRDGGGNNVPEPATSLLLALAALAAAGATSRRRS